MSAQATIVGLGLIGGSIGKALRAKGWRIAFVDPAVPLQAAQVAGAADEKLDEAGDGLIIVAAPVDAATAIITQLSALRREDVTVMSVCSVMRPLHEAAGELRFIATHPLAGSERTGLEAATSDLFANKPWFVERREETVMRVIEDCGAKPSEIDAAEHDRILAMTSHLPQVIATALGSLLADVDPVFIGTGARSMLRLAGSSHAVWSPLLEANQENVREFARELFAIVTTMNEGDFERAQRLYEKLRKS